MRVAVCSQGEVLDSKLDERFGRCLYFIIADTETGAFEAIRNSAADSPHGAGTAAVQVLVSHDVHAVIAGNLGPNASRILAEAGIEAYRAEGETVREVLEKFRSGSLVRLTGPTREHGRHV